MLKKGILGAIIAVIVVGAVVPAAYGLAQRAAISSLEFDFDRFEMTDADFSETKTFGSMKQISESLENPSISTLQSYANLQSSLSSPQSFALDILANTRLTYSMFVNVHNPSFIEAVIDRADVTVSVNGKELARPISIKTQQKIPAGGDVIVELSGISLNGKDVAAVLLNLPSDKFILSFDFAITSYYPTIFGEMPIPANVNLQMHLIPPKPIMIDFEEPGSSNIQQVSFDGDKIYKLSFKNDNHVPIEGALEIGVMKGNSLDNVGLCDPACIAPIDSGLATIIRLKGGSIFGVQVFDDNYRISPGESVTFTVKNPELRSKANSAFIVRWAPNYSKIPYVMSTEIMGITKTSIGDYESQSFSLIRQVAYNLVNDFGYVGFQKFIAPDKSTTLTLLSSSSAINYGSTVTLSGALLDHYGNGIPDQTIEIRENDPFNPDDLVGTTTTNSDGKYTFDWIASKSDVGSTMDIFASYGGNRDYEESRSNEASITGSKSAAKISFSTSTTSPKEGEQVRFSGKLVDHDGKAISSAKIYIKDEDTGTGDDDIGIVFTSTDGTYSYLWEAKEMDLESTVETFAVFEGDTTYAEARSEQIDLNVSGANVSPTVHTTSLQFQPSKNTANTGDVILFSGRLTDNSGLGVSNRQIDIKEDRSFATDSILVSTFTDSSGYFSVSWQADPAGTIDVFSVFEGDSQYAYSRSPNTTIAIANTTPESPQHYSTSLSLQASSTIVNQGDIVSLSGRLVDNFGNGVEGATLYLKDEDAGSGDDDIGSLITGSNGNYIFNWSAKTMDPFDSVVEVYAVFEGSSSYDGSRSSQVDVEVS